MIPDVAIDPALKNLRVQCVMNFPLLISAPDWRWSIRQAQASEHREHGCTGVHYPFRYVYLTRMLRAQLRVSRSSQPQQALACSLVGLSFPALHK